MPLVTRAFEDAVARTIEKARAAWPELDLTPALFRPYLLERMPEGPNATAAIESLHAADLYLACACAVGDPRALAAFERELVPRLRAHLVRRYGSSDLVDDAAQQMRELLFMPATPGAAPKIATYSGRGPLGGWLRVTAARLVLRHARQAQAAAGVPLDSSRIPLRSPDGDPQIGLLRAHYRREFGAALEATLASLSSRERTILRLHYLEGTTMEAIAALYRVHRLTVSRWLARVRRHLLEETRRRLSEQISTASTEWGSVLAMVGSQLDVSIRRHLATRGG